MKKSKIILLTRWGLLLLVFLFANTTLKAQVIDSMAFHLYTDSLKKGVHNYINVDGHLHEGRWIPLSSKDLKFTSTAGKFEGNNLLIAPDFTGEKVSITATYNRNPALNISTTIYIKIGAETVQLKTLEEVMRPDTTGKKTGKKKKGNQ